MLRRLSTLAPAVLLLLSVSVCVLWVRSYWRTDNVSDVWPAWSGSWDVTSARGEIRVDDGPRRRAALLVYERRLAAILQEADTAVVRTFRESEEDRRWHREQRAAEAAEARAHAAALLAPVRAERGQLLGPSTVRTVPHCLPALAASVLPAAWLRAMVTRRRERVRRMAGRGPACGPASRVPSNRGRARH